MKKKKNKGWYCPACGKFNGEESKFCLYCGAQNAMQNNMRPAPKKQFKGLTVALGIVLIALIGHPYLLFKSIEVQIQQPFRRKKRMREQILRKRVKR